MDRRAFRWGPKRKPIFPHCPAGGLALREACHAAIVDALTDDADTARALAEVVGAVIGDD